MSPCDLAIVEAEDSLPIKTVQASRGAPSASTTRQTRSSSPDSSAAAAPRASDASLPCMARRTTAPRAGSEDGSGSAPVSCALVSAVANSTSSSGLPSVSDWHTRETWSSTGTRTLNSRRLASSSSPVRSIVGNPILSIRVAKPDRTAITRKPCEQRVETRHDACSSTFDQMAIGGRRVRSAPAQCWTSRGCLRAWREYMIG